MRIMAAILIVLSSSALAAESNAKAVGQVKRAIEKACNSITYGLPTSQVNCKAAGLAWLDKQKSNDMGCSAAAMRYNVLGAILEACTTPVDLNDQSGRNFATFVGGDWGLARVQCMTAVFPTQTKYWESYEAVLDLQHQIEDERTVLGNKIAAALASRKMDVQLQGHEDPILSCEDAVDPAAKSTAKAKVGEPQSVAHHGASRGTSSGQADQQ